MQDPSYGIPDPLIGHVHLISSHRYPFTPRMQLNQAYSCLFEAPKIVKQHAAMSWQYLTAPQDGTVFLTWLGPRQNDVFPTDGYIWAGPEERMTQEFGGYTVDLLIQHAGYRPGIDATTSHSRRRYRLIHKNPNVNANPPDRNLWIVHYSQAEPQRVVPASQVTISRYQQTQLQQRHFIDGQGQLENKEFMLHDRERWPVLKLTGRGVIQAVQGAGVAAVAPQQQTAVPPNVAAHVGNPRFGGQHYQAAAQAAVGSSPAKRQRTSTVAEVEQPVASKYHDIEAEEEFASGDYLDTISARDVSKARFIQHHEWAEEVLSSPYATRQIEPAYLGFGLMGELAGLTNGIFETVRDAVKVVHGEDEGPPSAEKVSAVKMKQFEDRVREYLVTGQQEMKTMKEEHARRMEDMKRDKMLSKAERRLRNARWLESSGSVESVMNGLVSGKGDEAEDADRILTEIESLVGKAMKEQRSVELVKAGGLKEKLAPLEQELVEVGVHDETIEAAEGPMFGFGQTMSSAPQHVLAAPGTAARAPSVPQQAPHQQQQPQLPPSTAPAAIPTAVPADGAQSAMDFNADDMDTLNASTFEIEGMDLDGPEFTFDTSNEATPGASARADAMPATTAQPTADLAAAGGAPPRRQQLPVPQSTTAPAGQQGRPGESTGAAPSHQATPVSDSAFDEFTTHDDDEGRAGDLVDFDGADGAGESMQHSAFGDAFGDA